MRMCVYVRERGKEKTGEKERENNRNGKRKKCGAAHAGSYLRKKKKQD